VVAAVAMSGGSVPLKTVTIDLGEPPLLLVHGLADTTVPYAVAAPACLLTILLGNVCEQVLDPDAGHIAFGVPEARDFLYRWMVDGSGLRTPTRLTVFGTDSLLH
jgi:predicted esterase